MDLIDIAHANYYKMFNSCGNFFLADATIINPAYYGNKFILYLFNPFDGKIISKMLDRFENYDVIVIYSHPVYQEIFPDRGFNKIFQTNGFHGNLNTIGLHKRGSGE